MTYRTVKRYADATTPEELFQGQWQGRPSKLDEFKPYMDQRWSAGCTNAWTLWEEITTRGFRGSYQTVQAYICPKRTSAQPGTADTPAATTAGTPHPPATAGRFRSSGPVSGVPENPTTPSVCPSALVAGCWLLVVWWCGLGDGPGRQGLHPAGGC
ncbi:hypothetical protein [Kitasatospora sp. NPDC056181]|uniref:hypothetical protein n=1 Tax=Kitasatospora sp. NPDC056181 TaxID=3345737 RepID=UPI0035D7C0F9